MIASGARVSAVDRFEDRRWTFRLWEDGNGSHQDFGYLTDVSLGTGYPGLGRRFLPRRDRDDQGVDPRGLAANQRRPGLGSGCRADLTRSNVNSLLATSG